MVKRKKIKLIAFFIVVFTIISILPIFADFAGDGTGSGNPIYNNSGITQIDIGYIDGGSTDSIDNITFGLIPMYSDGSLSSEVSRGVYSATGSFYRYTTLITRNTSSRIIQKQTFDSPLFNSVTRLSVTYYAPIVFDNSFSMALNAVTNDIQGTCTLTNIRASYKVLTPSIATQDITDSTLVMAQSTYDNRTYSNVPITQTLPYNFTFSSIDDTENLVVDMKLTFDIYINTPGIFSLSSTFDYLQNIPEYSSYSDIIVDNIYNNIEYVTIDEIPFTEVIINTFERIGDVQLFGTFTVSDVMWGFIGILVIIVFLKFFAGG